MAGTHCTYDESLEPSKSPKTGIRQYLPKKPTKWGIKDFVMCDADNGIPIWFETYKGRSVGMQETSNTTDDTLTVVKEAVVSTLGKSLLRGSILFADNYYTSTPLALALFKDHDVHFVGTIRTNRVGWPVEVAYDPKRAKERAWIVVV